MANLIPACLQKMLLPTFGWGSNLIPQNGEPPKMGVVSSACPSTQPQKGYQPDHLETALIYHGCQVLLVECGWFACNILGYPLWPFLGKESHLEKEYTFREQQIVNFLGNTDHRSLGRNLRRPASKRTSMVQSKPNSSHRQLDAPNLGWNWATSCLSTRGVPLCRTRNTGQF